MAGVAGLVLGVLGGADICTKVGRSLYTKYRVYKDAELKLRELSLRLKTHWFKIETEIALIKDVDHVLEENLRIHFAELLELLSGNSKMPS